MEVIQKTYCTQIKADWLVSSARLCGVFLSNDALRLSVRCDWNGVILVAKPRVFKGWGDVQPFLQFQSEEQKNELKSSSSHSLVKLTD